MDRGQLSLRLSYPRQLNVESRKDCTRYRDSATRPSTDFHCQISNRESSVSLDFGCSMLLGTQISGFRVSCAGSTVLHTSAR
jgi:hypothetical protein